MKRKTYYNSIGLYLVGLFYGYLLLFAVGKVIACF
jgi:hypothetical protein